MSVPLEIGDRVWCLMHEPIGDRGERVNATGTVGCVVTGIADDQVGVIVTSASSSWHIGRQFVRPRGELYAMKDKVENAAFGALVVKLWGAGR